MIQYTEETQDERQANYPETLRLLICAMQHINALHRAIAQI